MDTLSILSYILAVISVITVIITIRQNSRMLESTSRPYVSIYFDYTNMGEPIGYFVIKNFGNSSAKITALSYNHIVKNQPTNLCKVSNILDDMIGSAISPGQKFILPIKVSDSPKGTCFFEITYVSSTKEYRDFFEITASHYGKLSKSRIKKRQNRPFSILSFTGNSRATNVNLKPPTPPAPNQQTQSTIRQKQSPRLSASRQPV